MQIIAHYHVLFIVLACIFGFFMAWGIGANDVANAMGTSVGSGVLTLKQAVLIAIVFEFTGAYFAGGSVTQTISKGIVDIHDASIIAHPELIIYGMLSALLGAGIWLVIATRYGLPVSTTHSIIGAIVGFAAVGISSHAVHWNEVFSILTGWVLSPVIAGVVAFLLFNSIQSLIINTHNPLANAKKFVPFYIFIAALIISMITFFKGLKHVGIHFSEFEKTMISVGLSLVIALIGRHFIIRIPASDNVNSNKKYQDVEKVFGIMMIFTACSMAFAHGSNDAANAVGPLASIYGLIHAKGSVLTSVGVPKWTMLLGAIGIVIGLATYGYKVIYTIGKHITELTPSRGFSAELATATTIVLASGTGLPVSTTQTLVGAVLGVGLARGIGALNLRVIGTIFMSWVITVPAGALFAILFFYLFKFIMS